MTHMLRPLAVIGRIGMVVSGMPTKLPRTVQVRQFGPTMSTLLWGAGIKWVNRYKWNEDIINV